jgi:ribosomal protein L13E
VDRHALFAIATDSTGSQASFRLGLPTDWHTAVARHTRLKWDAPRPRAIRWLRRTYRITHYEVRSVDRHGRGLGSERHATAIPVPFRLAKVV